MTNQTLPQRIQRNAKEGELLPCPFCGEQVTASHRMDSEASQHGKYGHYAEIEHNCYAGLRCHALELFFSDAPNKELWEGMCRRLEKDWNTRAMPEAVSIINELEEKLRVAREALDLILNKNSSNFRLKAPDYLIDKAEQALATLDEKESK